MHDYAQLPSANCLPSTRTALTPPLLIFSMRNHSPQNVTSQVQPRVYDYGQITDLNGMRSSRDAIDAVFAALE